MAQAKTRGTLSGEGGVTLDEPSIPVYDAETMELLVVLVAAGSQFNLATIAIILAVILFSSAVHESAHAYVAYRCGDWTARDLGRITLNPVAHIDPIMTILVPIISYTLTGFPFGGAKPVPVNPFNLRHPRRDMMYVAIAGPASNLVLAVAAAGLLHLGGYKSPILSQILIMGVYYNLMFTIFNLIPIPPLDGSRVVSYFLSHEAADSYARIEPYGFFIIIMLLNFGALRYLLWGTIQFCASLLLLGPYL